ncbi:MAG: hypothetical protein IPL65_15965 [Lewinellaceae bacterium]|nr:hypothetical protein [Lewinellaceae bacterium]
MIARTFFTNLFVFTLLWVLALGGLMALFPAARYCWTMAVAASILFLVICIVLFLVGKKLISSSNKQAFTGLVMVSVFGKMVASLAFLFAYRSLMQPKDNWFVGLFLMCYLAYTVFEVWSLYHLAVGEKAEKS